MCRYKYFAEFRLKNEIDKLLLFPNTSLEKIQCTSEKYVCEYLYTLLLTEGIYRGRAYRFRISIPEAYPFVSPVIKCLEPIYHPNIDAEGNVCLEFLRHKWTSAMGIEWILCGIYLFLIDPCGEDALNTEAGDLLLEDYDGFVKKAQSHYKNRTF